MIPNRCPLNHTANSRSKPPLVMADAKLVYLPAAIAMAGHAFQLAS